MKKLSAIILCLALCLICAVACADVVAVTGQGSMETPYHQLTTIFVEYSENVAAPDADTYRVMDLALSAMKEDYECRPYDVGVITAVYTNDQAARREDKTSVEGKYVVIELAGTDGSYFDEEEQLWKPRNITGIATVRFAGEKKQHTRTDWSLLTVFQLKDVVNANGDVVAAHGVLPALPNEALYTPETAAAFQQMSIPSSNGNYDIYYNLHLPENYDETKQYPVIICENGGGGGLTTAQLLPDGSYACLGADITLDAVAISFVRANPELIVVAYQRWDTFPEEWGVDKIRDLVELNEYVRANYAVDQNRVYAIGSSAGTMNISEGIMARPDLFNGYVQCNGSFMTPNAEGGFDRFTMYKDELMISYVDYTADQIWEISNDPESYLDQAVIDETGKCFDGVVEYRIPIYFFDGVNTQSGSSLNTTADYLYLTGRYKALGLSDAEIAELVRVYVANNDEYHANGICEYHASSKLAVTEGHDVIDWILSR